MEDPAEADDYPGEPEVIDEDSEMEDFTEDYTPSTPVYTPEHAPAPPPPEEYAPAPPPQEEYVPAPPPPPAEEPRLCGICTVVAATEGGLLCPDCRTFALQIDLAIAAQWTRGNTWYYPIILSDDEESDSDSD